MGVENQQEGRMIHKWVKGQFISIPDPRASEEEDDDYEKWMNDAGFTKGHTPVGQIDAEQFAYELWKHKEEKWIVDLTIQGDCYQLLVEGLPDLLSLLNHLAPIVLAHTVSGDAMSYLEDKHFEESRKEREIYKKRWG